MNKCSVVFVTGMAVATASYAFFGDWMKVGMGMPQQMMQGSMQMMNQPQSCDCSCKE